MGTAGGRKDNIVANASMCSPTPRPRERAGGGEWGEKRDPDSHMPGGDRERW